jgi:hypothetical protein
MIAHSIIERHTGSRVLAMKTGPFLLDNGRAELYRQHSSDALGVVWHVADPKVKQTFVELAAAWQRLADMRNKWAVDVPSQCTRRS